MALAGGEFTERVRYLGLAHLPARAIVQKALERRFDYDASGNMIVFEEFVPWYDSALGVCALLIKLCENLIDDLHLQEGDFTGLGGGTGHHEGAATHLRPLRGSGWLMASASRANVPVLV